MQDCTDFSTGNNSGRRKSLRQAVSEENSDAIKVVCRFRPTTAKSSKKTAAVTGDCYSFSDDNSVQFVSDISDGKLFTYDKVFGTDSTQSQVFGELCGVVESVMSGFNGTIMAYGQTSAGKSWTMEGPSLWDLEYQGVIPRCVDALFDAIDEADPDIEFQVTISYYEIYCEKVRDLLNPSQFNLKIRETRADGFVVQDVTEVFCTDREGVLRVIELGKANRASAPTLMNAESSRSHSIVTLVVEQKDVTTGRKKRGMLFLVDLAGSEKVSKTGASGMRLEEAKNINRSLTTLGMVINALCDGAPHIPYRDSTLTLILKDALGGNSKTTLVICCNPDLRHTPETLSTLRFGERAKRIKNNARVNEEYSVDELKALLAAARKEIETLKRKLAAALTGKVMLDLDDGAAAGGGEGGGTGVRGQRSRSLRHTRSFSSTSMGMVAAAAGGGAAAGIEVRLESVESMSMELDDRSPETKGGGGALERGKGEEGLGGRESKGIMSRSVDFSLEGLGVQRINSDGNIDDSEDEHQLQLQLQEEQQRGNAGGGGGVGRALIRRQSAGAATFGGSASGSGKMRGMQAEGSGDTAADGVAGKRGDRSGNSSRALMVTVPVQEIAELKARLASMEEELEEERIRWRTEHESCISIAAESEALRSTIFELEDKLIKSNLDLKRVESYSRFGAPTPGGSSSAGATLSPSHLSNHSGHSTRSQSVGSPGQPFFGSPDPAQPKSSSFSSSVAGERQKASFFDLYPIPDGSADSSDGSGIHTDTHTDTQPGTDRPPSQRSSRQHAAALAQAQMQGADGLDSLTSSPEKRSTTSEREREKEEIDAMIHNAVRQSADSTGLRKSSDNARVSFAGDELNASHDNAIEHLEHRMTDQALFVNTVTVPQLGEKGETLRAQLEMEIDALEKDLKQQETVAMTVQSAAESYAEKYLQLREDYETHVQRLMYKLTQEQQARTHIEDKLEEALIRLWKQSEASAHNTRSTKSFLASLFWPSSSSSSRSSNNYNHYNSNSSSSRTVTSRASFSVAHSGSGSGAEGENSFPAALSEREANVSRALELAQFRVTQLIAELEATREAQLIVLETKESVMRSLVKQNSQLTIERDTLHKRVEDMAATVDQLTNLLRSVQTRKYANMMHTPLHSAKSFNKIHGGGQASSKAGGGGVSGHGHGASGYRLPSVAAVNAAAAAAAVAKSRHPENADENGENGNNSQRSAREGEGEGQERVGGKERESLVPASPGEPVDPASS